MCGGDASFLLMTMKDPSEVLLNQSAYDHKQKHIGHAL